MGTRSIVEKIRKEGLEVRVKNNEIGFHHELIESFPYEHRKHLAVELALHASEILAITLQRYSRDDGRAAYARDEIARFIQGKWVKFGGHYFIGDIRKDVGLEPDPALQEAYQNG